MTRNGFAVVDCDGHVTEPASLYLEYIDPAYRERVRRLGEWAKEVPEMGKRGASPRGLVRLSRRQLGTRDASENVVPTDPYRRKNYPFGGVHHPWAKPQSGIDPHQTKKDFAELGIDRGVLVASGAAGAQTVGDAEFEAARCTAYNRWAADFCSAYPGEFYGMAVVPLLDIRYAVKEVARVAQEKWCVGITTPCRVGDKLADHPYFHPLYAALQDNDLTLGVHAFTDHPTTPGRDDLTDSYFLLHLTGHIWQQMVVMAAIIGGGTLEKFPRLRVAHLESGCGWLPYWMERMDTHKEKLPESVPLLTLKPSEHIKSGRVFVSADAQEETVPMVAQLIGENVLVFASDYPHYDADLPGVVDNFVARKDLTPGLKKKILGENAYRLYRRLS